MTVYKNKKTVMKRIGCFVCALLLSACLLCSCTQSADSGVVIVPSSRTETAEPSADTVSDTQTEVGETEAAVTETTAADGETTADAAGTEAEAEDFLALAREMMDDAAFSALLAQYGADSESALGAVAAVLAYQRTQISDGAMVAAGTVYWTGSGSVWHVTRECSALAKSKSVQSGTAAEAAEQGKTRVCKRCGE